LQAVFLLLPCLLTPFKLLNVLLQLSPCVLNVMVCLTPHFAGPKTLCNACGVRYQRSQSKAKSNKRQASERARNDRGSPMHARAPKQACLANRTAAAANDASKAAADGTTAGHGHGTRSASKGGSSRFASQQQNGSGRQRGALQGHGGSSAGRIVQRQPQQQHLVQHGGAMHGAAGLGMYELHFYEDEGSPPGMHTHILEEDEEEDEQQVLLRDVSGGLACICCVVVFEFVSCFARACCCCGSLEVQSTAMLIDACCL
jgi:hypothetical protein